jgi:hypothetical protein
VVGFDKKFKKMKILNCYIKSFFFKNVISCRDTKNNVLYLDIIRICPSIVISARKTCHIKLHVQYSLPNDEHKMFETRRRHQELN